MKYRGMIAVVTLVILLCSATGFYIHKISDGNKAVFLPMDEFLIDVFVPQNQGQNTFLKVKLTLEVEHKKDVDAVMMQMPKIRDVINYYMRDMRADDLTGSGSIYYLRQEILLRVNKILFPIVIKNVLFSEIVRS